MDTRKIKAQTSLQFILLVSFMFLIYLTFLIYHASESKNYEIQEEFILTKDIALKINSEIVLANKMKNGYTRYFELPSTLNSHNYSISTINNEILVYTDDAENSITTPPFTGTIKKGKNTIKKINDTICLNC